MKSWNKKQNFLLVNVFLTINWYYEVKEKKDVKKLFKRYEKLIPFTVMMRIEKF